QVGVDPPRRVVLDDVPEVVDLLADLQAGRPPEPTGPASYAALDRLLDAGLVVDADERSGRAAGRSDGPVSLDVPLDLLPTTTRLLREAGLDSTTGPADVRLVVRDGDVSRAVLDTLVREEVAHLVVTLAGDAAVVGPYVEPGRTAC